MTGKLTLKSFNDLVALDQANNNNATRNVPLATSFDQDGDSLPDHWERLYGLDPSDPMDALGDPDGDGITNLDEFRQGSNPLRSDEVERAAASVTGRKADEPLHPKRHEKASGDNPTDG